MLSWKAALKLSTNVLIMSSAEDVTYRISFYFSVISFPVMCRHDILVDINTDKRRLTMLKGWEKFNFNAHQLKYR